MLRIQAVYKLFENNVKENRWLYGTGDLGEVYAISLAQTFFQESVSTRGYEMDSEASSGIWDKNQR